MKKTLFFTCALVFAVLMCTSCEKSPEAAFTVDKETVETGIAITFTNNSQNSESYSWNFGDGASSTQVSPTHSYSEAGQFNVTLTANGNGETSTATMQIDIFNVVPGVRIGNFKLGNTLQKHISYISEATYQHGAFLISAGEYLHIMLFTKTGVGFFWISYSVNAYNNDVPDAIYITTPFKARTEKKITFGSLLSEVATAYGTPDEIESDGSYSYMDKLGISFWADDAKTKVEAIYIEEPSKKSFDIDQMQLKNLLLNGFTN